MTQFTDNKGRTWSVAIDVGSVRRVRQRTEFDLMAIVQPGNTLFQAIVQDPVVVGEILYALCSQQAERLVVSEDDFLSGFAGDVIVKARDALLEGLVDFFPNAVERAAMRRVLTALQTTIRTVQDEAMAKLDAGTIEREIENALAKSGDTSGAAQESLASTPSD